MPVEIFELILRARIQQSSTENESQPGRETAQSTGNGANGQGQQTDQMRPTVEEIVHDILKRKKER